LFLDIVVIAVCLIFLLNTNISIAKKHKLPFRYVGYLHLLLAYHVIFSLVFTLYIRTAGGDSYGYWYYLMQQVPVHFTSWHEFFGTSTTFILWLNYVPSKLMGLGYITGNLLYSFLGFLGLRYLFVMTAELWPTNYSILNISLFPTIFFFPNLHFWSAGVGKDAICFWGIAWFLYAIQNYKRRWWQAAAAIFFVYMARPHMGLSYVTAAAIAILVGSEIKREYKILLSGLAGVGILYLSIGALEFLKIEDFSFETLESLTARKSGYLSTAGSAVAIGSYSLPMRLFTYMYRPLFFDAHNVMSFLSGFENVLYLYLTFFIVRNWTPEALGDMPVFVKVGIIGFIPITLAFANSLSNLGIIMRMKNMTMIYFVLFVFFLISYSKHLRSLKAAEKLEYYKKRQDVIDSKKAGLTSSASDPS
jgi:hypothetical protein